MSRAKETFKELSVVIPAYNAEACVGDTLDAVQGYLASRELPGEIIVVDDGSTDQTAALVERRGRGVKLLRNPANQGKGYAVRRGMLATQCAWAAFMDVDNSTSIDHLERFALQADGADVLIASRNLEGSRIVRAQPAIRQMSGRTFPYLVRRLVLPNFRDTQCGFKVFRRETVPPIFSRQCCRGFCFDVEVLLIASRLGYRIVELPVDWDNPRPSTIRLWRDPPRMLGELLGIAWRHRPAAYAEPAMAPQRPIPAPSGSSGEL